MAIAEAFKRLKPAPKKVEERRFTHASQRTKTDRRADGQRRQHRNDRGTNGGERSEGSRFIKRADGSPVQRPEGAAKPKRPFRGRRRFSGGNTRAA
jgi:ATP-dependent RNA helicase RhlE